MVKVEKRRQRDEESIDKFLDDLELLRRRSETWRLLRSSWME